MEIELGAPCSRATVLGKPAWSTKKEKVVFPARFNRSRYAIDVEVDDTTLLDLNPGDEIYISGDGYNAGSVIRHNKLVRWFILTFC